MHGREKCVSQATWPAPSWVLFQPCLYYKLRQRQDRMYLCDEENSVCELTWLGCVDQQMPGHDREPEDQVAAQAMKLWWCPLITLWQRRPGKSPELLLEDQRGCSLISLGDWSSYNSSHHNRHTQQLEANTSKQDIAFSSEIFLCLQWGHSHMIPVPSWGLGT